MTQNDKYINLAIMTFSSTQEKYKLKLDVRNTVLNYSSKTYSFSVYFEKYFEFYICFHLNNTNLRLHDIAVWLGFNDYDIALLTRTQIRDQHTAESVLTNLRGVLEKLLVMLEKKPELLDEFLKNKGIEEQDQLSEAILTSIQLAWESKDFERFLMLVESNRVIVEQSKAATLILKQEAFIRKKTGDGSLS